MQQIHVLMISLWTYSWQWLCVISIPCHSFRTMTPYNWLICHSSISTTTTTGTYQCTELLTKRFQIQSQQTWEPRQDTPQRQLKIWKSPIKYNYYSWRLGLVVRMLLLSDFILSISLMNSLLLQIYLKENFIIWT